MNPVPPMRQAKFLVIWLLIAVVCGFMVFFLNASMESDLDRRGAVSTATVTEQDCNAWSARDQSFDAKDDQHEFFYLSCPAGGVKVGQQVQVLYDTQDPRGNARLVGQNDDTISAIFFAVAIAASVTLIGWAIRVRTQPVPWVPEPEPVKAPINTASGPVDRVGARKNWPVGYKGRHRR